MRSSAGNSPMKSSEVSVPSSLRSLAVSFQAFTADAESRLGAKRRRNSGNRTPLVSQRESREVGASIQQVSHGTLGAVRGNRRADPVVEVEDELCEEIFGQLWAIPNSRANPKREIQREDGGCLVWIRKDLVREKWIRAEDCFPVTRSYRVREVPSSISFSRDILGRDGSKASYAEVLQRVPMAEGGRWVWQPEGQPFRPAQRQFQQRG